MGLVLRDLCGTANVVTTPTITPAVVSGDLIEWDKIEAILSGQSDPVEECEPDNLGCDGIGCDGCNDCT